MDAAADTYAPLEPRVRFTMDFVDTPPEPSAQIVLILTSMIISPDTTEKA